MEVGPEHRNPAVGRLTVLLCSGVERGCSVAETPYPKKVLHLPEILSQEEVARPIDAAEFPFHRILLMTLYATGARRAEVANLKISDIDSRRMPCHFLSASASRPKSVRSRAASAAHRRPKQLYKSSGPAQPHTNPIGSREGRLPSSRCN